MEEQIKTTLILRIHQADKVDQKAISEKDTFTIGQRPDNDLTLFGQEYPKSHTLIAKRDGYYQLYLPQYLNDGEIRENDSTLKLKQLMSHGILPMENNNYVIRLSPQKQGFLTFGETRIDFLFDRRKIVRYVIPEFEGFSWVNVTIKSLFSDLLFKSIFLTLIILNFLILYLFKDYEIKVEEKIDTKKIQQRFAKFILKTPEEIMAENTRALTTDMTTGADKTNSEKSNTNKPAARRPGREGGAKRGNPAATAGLLGLIGGTGTGSKASSVVDALVDRGLVTELNNILGGGTNLKVGGQKTKNGIDPLDQLIGTGGSGGIDDFLASMDDGAEEVTLQRQVRVNLAKPTKTSGDAEAIGYRTEQSVMSMVNSKMGRITWLYEKYLKQQPNLTGKLTIEFTIAANGFVSDVRMIESTLNHPEMEREIISLIKRLKFEPIPSGSFTVVFPFHFKKIN